ncbi:hypothetical protein SH1V18_01530 [Vallitalea longa]|uniref:histidine kinase n=1 Tax=Vallitalea longa TaxID=2936439 RepID=A0A9W5YAE5_9FIRM|nr:sensor histidine kinase [Vallitalea longa]GKX27673.1 hypothetical protein SH1V18_01530 [Vallitalea longa]
MELHKRIRVAILCNVLLIVLIIVGVIMEFSPIIFIATLIIVDIGVLISLYCLVVKPLITFDVSLNQCIENAMDSEEILKKVSDGILFGPKIKNVIEKYSNKKIRGNSAIMYDKQAELTALQSQINPHFLYNTLDSIRGQALIDDNDEIAEMVEALAVFFRYSISRKGDLVTLRDELAYIQNYMTIQQYRFNNRFSLEIYIDEEDQKAYDYFIPKLILQPIVENSIFHGLEDSLESGKVEIEVIVTDSNLILTVSDNGKGMDSKSLLELNRHIRASNQNLENNEERKKKHTGIALANIQRRIKLLFGEEYGLNVYSTIDQGTDVEITLPTNYERKTNKQ